MARIPWLADAGSTTGFARVTHAIGERLVRDFGHEIHVIASNYKGDPYPTVSDPTPLGLYVPNVYVQGDIYGRSRFIELANKVEPEVVVILNDPQVAMRHLFENQYDPESLLVQKFPVVLYQPIDGYEIPPRYDLLAKYTNRIAMSKFGQEAMPDSKLIYHGVDLEMFWPVSSQHSITTSRGQALKTKADCKEAIGLPRDSFVVGRVDSNTGRKDYPALWKALRPVMKKHTDIVGYFHCRASNARSGVDIPAMVSRDTETNKRFYYPGELDPNHGFAQADINAVYNAIDLFVSTSRGEGFGLTLAESLACGVPVIAQNCSAIPEVVGPGGELVEPAMPFTVPFGQDQMLADIPAFSEAIERAYLSRGWRRTKGKAGKDHVESTFKWDDKAASFHDCITGLIAGVEVENHGTQDAAEAPG